MKRTYTYFLSTILILNSAAAFSMEGGQNEQTKEQIANNIGLVLQNDNSKSDFSEPAQTCLTEARDTVIAVQERFNHHGWQIGTATTGSSVPYPALPNTQIVFGNLDANKINSNEKEFRNIATQVSQDICMELTTKSQAFYAAAAEHSTAIATRNTQWFYSISSGVIGVTALAASCALSRRSFVLTSAIASVVALLTAGSCFKTLWSGRTQFEQQGSALEKKRTNLKAVETQLNNQKTVISSILKYLNNLKQVLNTSLADQLHLTIHHIPDTQAN